MTYYNMSSGAEDSGNGMLEKAKTEAQVYPVCTSLMNTDFSLILIPNPFNAPSQSVPDELKGYVFRITGGNDK